MQRWEYLTLEASKNYGTTKFFVNGEMQTSLKNAEFSTIINQLGGQGWELVGISAMDSTSTYIFKRGTDKAMAAPKEKPPA
jgi:hypothetical protein